MKHFMILVALALGITAACVWNAKQPAGKKGSPFSNPTNDNSRHQYYAPREHAALLHNLTAAGTSTNAEAVTNLRTVLTHVFDTRLEQYQATLASLNKNLWYQLIFLTAALVTVFKRLPSFKVPVIDTEVPVRWVYLALPACLVYLWLCFGFFLNELIDARIVLWKITEAMQATPGQFTSPAEWRGALYTFSLNPAVYDGGYMDGWFVNFRPQYTLLGQPQVMGYVIMTLFGIFLGASNGAALGLILHGRKRFIEPSRHHWLQAGYFWLAAVLLCASHVLFWLHGDHPNWQQPIIAVVACAVTGWLMTRPVQDAAEEKPAVENTGNGFMMLLVNQQLSARIEKADPATAPGVPKIYSEAKKPVTEDCSRPGRQQ